MTKLFLGVIAAGLLSPLAQVATAGGEGNPFNGPPSNRLIFPLFRKQSLPAFQAAPWYLYWPYNGHFQTPAPLFGGYGGGYGGGGYGGGGYGGGYGGQMNPYFPHVAPPPPAKVPAPPTTDTSNPAPLNPLPMPAAPGIPSIPSAPAK